MFKKLIQFIKGLLHKRQGPLGARTATVVTDEAAIHVDEEAEISGLTAKATPVAGDFFLIEDSADSFSKKKVDASNVGSGDMTKAVYDPTNVTGDAFAMDNMAEGTDTKILTAAERTKISNSLENISEDTTPQLGGQLDAQSNSIGFAQDAYTGDGTTTIDWTKGNSQRLNLGAFDETVTFTDPAKGGNFTLHIKQDSVGGRDVTLPSNVKFLGTTPTFTDGGASKTMVLSLSYELATDTYWGQATIWEDATPAGGGGMELLGTTTLSSAASSISVDFTGSEKNRLVLDFSSPNLSASGQNRLRFNDDTASNYSYSINSEGNGNYSSATSGVILDQQASSQSRFYQINIVNYSSSYKNLLLSCIGNHATNGGGFWMNTSAQIKKITIITGAGNFNIGTVLRVYGQDV